MILENIVKMLCESELMRWKLGSSANAKIKVESTTTNRSHMLSFSVGSSESTNKVENGYKITLK